MMTLRHLTNPKMISHLLLANKNKSNSLGPTEI